MFKVHFLTHFTFNKEILKRPINLRNFYHIKHCLLKISKHYYIRTVLTYDIIKFCYMKEATRYYMNIPTNICMYHHVFMCRLILPEFIKAQEGRLALDFIFSKQFCVF